MSEKLRLRDEVLSSVGKVVVDTSFQPEGYFETMVFHCKLNGSVDYSNVLDCQHSKDADTARQEHLTAIKKWKV